MLPVQLPEHIDPAQLADRQAALRGQLPLAAMKRLAGSLLSQEGAVEVELDFGRDAGGRRVVEGRAEVAVQMVCQRCLTACDQHLQTRILLGVVASEAEAERLPDEYDPLVSDGRVRLLELVEDELILALPLLAKHEEETECVPQSALRTGEPEEPGKQRQDNPFAALAQLKKRKHQDN